MDMIMKGLGKIKKVLVENLSPSFCPLNLTLILP